MNKRQRKKRDNKILLFETFDFVTVYKELKEVDRMYHEFCIRIDRERKTHKGCWGFDF